MSVCIRSVLRPLAVFSLYSSAGRHWIWWFEAMTSSLVSQLNCQFLGFVILICQKEMWAIIEVFNVS
jgi:hypothetical protein